MLMRAGVTRVNYKMFYN